MSSKKTRDKELEELEDKLRRALQKAADAVQTDKNALDKILKRIKKRHAGT